jgi:hypothetical protein
MYDWLARIQSLRPSPVFRERKRCRNAYSCSPFKFVLVIVIHVRPHTRDSVGFKRKGPFIFFFSSLFLSLVLAAAAINVDNLLCQERIPDFILQV